jgi:predicted site-specific integrase-resolvase
MNQVRKIGRQDTKGDGMETLVMINEAAKIIDRSPSLVRWYENEGRLSAMRTSGGVRLFKRRDVEKLAEELRAKRQAKADVRSDAR